MEEEEEQAQHRAPEPGGRGSWVKFPQGTAPRLVARRILTPRQAEVAALIWQGDSNKEIARKLHVSVHTAKAHVSQVLHRLGAESRTQAASKWKEMETAAGQERGASDPDRQRPAPPARR